MFCRQLMLLIKLCSAILGHNILVPPKVSAFVPSGSSLGLIYEGQSKNNEPKSLLAIFVAIKSKVIHQKKAQG